MQKIEDHRFSAEVNLAAGSKAFSRILQNHEMFRALLELAKEPGAVETIAKRVIDLSGRQVDPQYENVFDAALSAYLTALRDTAKPELIAEASSAAAAARNCWWTPGLSRELLVRALATGVVAQTAATGMKIPQEHFTKIWSDMVNGLASSSAQRNQKTQILFHLGLSNKKAATQSLMPNNFGNPSPNRRQREKHRDLRAIHSKSGVRRGARRLVHA